MKSDPLYFFCWLLLIQTQTFTQCGQLNKPRKLVKFTYEPKKNKIKYA